MKPSTRKDILGIFMLTFLSVGIASLLRDSSCPPDWSYGSDSNIYLDLAHNLLTHHGYTQSPGVGYHGLYVTTVNRDYVPNLSMLPGYPILLAAATQVAGTALAPYVVAYILFLMMSFSVFIMGRLLFDHELPESWFWGVFIIFQILQPALLIQLQAIGQDLAASTFTSLFILAFVLRMQSLSRAILRTGFLLLTLVLTLLTRSNMLALLFPLLVGGLFLARHDRFSPRWKAFVLAIGVLFALLSVRLYTMKRMTGHAELASNAGTNLFITYVYFELPPAVLKSEISQETQRFESLLSNGVSAPRAQTMVGDFYGQESVTYIRAHKMKTVKTILMGLRDIFIGTDYFRMSRLLFIRGWGESMIHYDYDFKRLYAQHSSVVQHILYQLIDKGFYVLFILVPCIALLGVFGAGLRRFLKNPFYLEDNPEGILLIIVASSITFLVSTALVVASSRMRLPVSVASYCSVLAGLRYFRGRSDVKHF